jgi:hypothetical protein
MDELSPSVHLDTSYLVGGYTLSGLKLVFWLVYVKHQRSGYAHSYDCLNAPSERLTSRVQRAKKLDFSVNALIKSIMKSRKTS